jgi:hypothetical protein
LEYLGIDLSIVVFFAYMLSVLGIFWMLTNPSGPSLFVMVFFWFLLQVSFLSYGLMKDQAGFLLIFALNIVIVFVGMFVRVEGDREYDDE